jgi:hypothetical protein
MRFFSSASIFSDKKTWNKNLFSVHIKICFFPAQKISKMIYFLQKSYTFFSQANVKIINQLASE